VFNDVDHTETPAMQLILTRNGVAAGDDFDAPHRRIIKVTEGLPLDALLRRVTRTKYLPSISGGAATRSVTSGVPLAVIAQQWDDIKWLPGALQEQAALDLRDGALHLHFNYHTQIDPGIVFEVLRSLQLRSPDY